MNTNYCFTLCHNLFDVIEASTKFLYERNPSNNFKHIIADVGFVLEEDNVIPDDFESARNRNTEKLKSLAKKYGSEYIRIENIGVSQNWNQIIDYVKMDDSDILIGCDPDEVVKTDNWVEAFGKILRTNEHKVAMCCLIMEHHKGEIEDAWNKRDAVIEGDNCYLMDGILPMAIIGFSGKFINESRHIRIPDVALRYGHIESVLTEDFTRFGYEWVVTPDYIVEHTMPCNLLHYWKSDVFTYGNNQCSFEDWLHSKKTDSKMIKQYEKKILVIGSSGFIGSNLMSELIKRENYYVVGCDNLLFGNIKNNNPNATFLFNDFNNLTSDYLNTFDEIVFVATSNIIYAMEFSVETFINNAQNAINLFNKFNGKIIYTSTSSVYGTPNEIPTTENANINTSNAYDVSKRIAEMYLKKRGNYTTLRLANTFGVNQRPDNPYCGVISKMIISALKKEPITIYGDGMQTRDFNYVSNVVDAILIAIESEAVNDEINISGGMEIHIKNLAAEIWLIVNGGKPILNYIENRKIDTIIRRNLSIEKAKTLLGWTPTISFNDGLKKTIHWLKDNYTA